MPEVTPICQFGTKAISFSLNGVDENTYNLDQIKGKNGTLIMFICNHCPYVIHIAPTLAKLADEYQKKGIAFVAINSNDTDAYPADSFELMKEEKAKRGYSFPYLYDADQSVAKA